MCSFRSSCRPPGRTRSALAQVRFRVRNPNGWWLGMERLVLRAEEEVIGRIGNENLVTHIAGD
jgi:hypothetical protein